MAARNLTDGLLSEDRVRSIARSARTVVPQDASTGDGTLEDQLKALHTLLHDVLFTCVSPGLKPSHRVAVWNTLCSLIDQVVESPVVQVTALFWTHDIWKQAFELCLNHAQSARPRSSRQLHVTLTNALRKCHDPAKTIVVSYATDRLVDCLADFESPYKAKASIQLIGHFLNKDILSLSDVLVSMNRAPTDELSSTTEHGLQQFTDVLLQWLGKAEFGSSIAQLLTILLDSADKELLSSENPFWVGPLQRALQEKAIDPGTLRVHILPVLFNRKFEDFVLFLQTLGLETLAEEAGKDSGSPEVPNSLFAALQTGKELGLVEDTEHSKVWYTGRTVFLPARLLRKLLSMASRSARLAGLSLLVISHSATKPFSLQALSDIQQTLGVMFADADADFRSEVFSVFQKLIDRLRAVTAVLARQIRSLGDINQLRDGEECKILEACFQTHRKFIFWLPRLLAWELRPTASYQRHISSLKCLSLLVRSGLDETVPRIHLSKAASGNTQWPLHMHIMTAELRRLLIDLMLDPFDDVRQISSAVLGMYASTVQQDTENYRQSSLASSLERAEFAMLRSGRADQADGVAHLYALTAYTYHDSDNPSISAPLAKEAVAEKLLNKLENLLSIAKNDLSEAVTKYPVHGIFTSVRYVMSYGTPVASSSVESRLVDCLNNVWNVVKPVLCNDAPEGYALEDLEETHDTTKETLSYCWRALKESSLLLSVLVANQQGSRDGHDIFFLMSELCFIQLAELRHRGAFSTVAQTWATCCQRCRTLPSSSGASLLDYWYARVMSLVRKNTTINTRRSAGLPSLLCGILIADESSTLLEQAVGELQEIAEQEVDSSAAEDGNLSQVHAMNCIKDILKNSRLGEQSERYLATALKLASDALQSDVWAIRNCGLMLFRAVIDRLLGTDQSFFDENALSSKHISTEEYPDFLDVILSLLSTNESMLQQTQSRYEGVFPALQLLAHTQLPADRMEETMHAVESLTTCTSWHVRDQAAKTIAALLMAKQQTAMIDRSINTIWTARSVGHNALHGSLLVVKYIFIAVGRLVEKRNDECKTSFEKSCIALCQAFLEAVAYENQLATNCFVTDTAFTDCIRQALGIAIAAKGLKEQHHVYRSIFDLCLGQGDEASSSSTIGHISTKHSLLQLCLRQPEAASLRQAVARLIAQGLLYDAMARPQDMQRYVPLVMDLARYDEDTCKHLLLALDLDTLSLSADCVAILSDLAVEIIQQDFGVELKNEAQNVLIELLQRDLAQTKILLKIPAKLLSDTHSHQFNQNYVDQNLQLRALSLERSVVRTEDVDEEILHEILAFTKDCTSAIEGGSIYTLEASADALDRMQSFWPRMSSCAALSSAYRSLCIAIYDLLNNDDEDIRTRASKIAEKVLAANDPRSASTFEPIVASQQLLKFMVFRWVGNRDLARISIDRAFGVSRLGSIAVREQLDSLSKGDTALFAEEKQNLYIDEAREVRVWSQVLQRLSIEAIPLTLAKKLALWVSEGVNALADQAQSRDGPLGWSTNADVFTLGLRVMYGVEILLGWARQGMRLPVKPSNMRKQLFDLEIAMRAGDVNGLWLWEAERILTGAALRKVAEMRILLGTIDPTKARLK